MQAPLNKPNYTKMKTKLFNLLGASFLGALMVAPLAFAGPSFPYGFPPSKRPAMTPAPVRPAACCVANNSCMGKECCDVKRAYYTPSSGRGIAWNELRTCKTSCTLGAADQHSVCKAGKGV
jgi:hypothetical protein